MKSSEEKGIYLYKQIVNNKEEVIELKKCYVNIDIGFAHKALPFIDKHMKSHSLLNTNNSYDSEMTQIYFNEESDPQSHDSHESEGKSCKKMKTNSNYEMKSKTKRLFTNNKSLIDLNGSENRNVYQYKEEIFISQSLSLTQMSALVQQNGRFTYFDSTSVDTHLKETSIKLKANVENLLKPLICEELESWALILKIINEDLFAFRKSSKYSIELVQKVLSHYNWCDLSENMTQNELNYFKGLHIQFITTFMRQLLLSCYSRDDMLSIISGSALESNAWTFVSQLISSIIVETNQESNSFSLAFLHLTLIIELLSRDFEQFLRESNDYCTDICSSDRNSNLKPVIVRLIWSTKSPNYINSVSKHLIFLIIKALKVENDFLLIELFKIFELLAESLRIGSGNVRPFVSFNFNKSTPINELFLQLNSESFVCNEVIKKLFSLISTLGWAKLQLCAHIIAQFVVDFRTRVSSKKSQLSLEMIICYVMTGDVNRYEYNLTKRINAKSPLKPMHSTPKSESPRKRSSLELSHNRRAFNSRKSWSKRNSYGENDLHISCRKGNSDKLRLLLQSTIDGFGCDPNEIDNSGYSPLCEAAVHGHQSCIEELIDWQKRSNQKLDYELCPMPDRQTALHDSIENDFIECSQLIIENGGFHLLEKKRTDGKTPKDLIKSNEMKRMIERVCETKFKSSVKININSAEDADIFITALTQMIVSYIEITKIDHFVGLSPDLWPNTFSQLFCREPNELDITFIKEDINAINELPQILKDFKKCFQIYPNTEELINELGIAFDCLLSN